MTDHVLDESVLRLPNEYNIYGQPGHFTVNFISPHNSIHQISGFKTEDDAQAWIAEAKVLIEKFP